MKRETNRAVVATLALAVLPLALCALDLSDKSDIRFAEAYAFSTNRAALIATLPRLPNRRRGSRIRSLTHRPRDASTTPTPC